MKIVSLESQEKFSMTHTTKTQTQNKTNPNLSVCMLWKKTWKNLDAIDKQS